jgi:hypothetical protein
MWGSSQICPEQVHELMRRLGARNARKLELEKKTTPPLSKYESPSSKSRPKRPILGSQVFNPSSGLSLKPATRARNVSGGANLVDFGRFKNRGWSRGAGVGFDGFHTAVSTHRILTSFLASTAP